MPTDALAGLDEVLKIHDLIDKAATKYKVDPNLVRRIAKTESNFNPKAKSDQGAQGVMQITPLIAKTYGVKDPYDAAQNIDGGTAFIAYLNDKYKGDEKKIAGAYHSGEGAVDRGELGPKGQAYVGKVSEADPLAGLDEAMAQHSVPAQVAQTQQMFPQGLGKTAEERQMQTKLLGQQIEQQQGNPSIREAAKTPPNEPPSLQDPSRPASARFLGAFGEAAGVPTGRMIKEGYRYWTDPKTSAWDKIKGYGVGLSEMATGMADLHRSHLTQAIDNFAAARNASTPMEALSNYGEAIRHSVGGVIPFIGPTVADAARMAEEGNWAGGTGAVAGLVLGPHVYKTPVKLYEAGKFFLGKSEFGPLKPTGINAAEYEASIAREMARHGELGKEAAKAEFPAASFQEIPEGETYRPKVNPEIGPFRVEQLEKPEFVGGGGVPGASRQSMIATGSTVPESSKTAPAIMRREMRLRTAIGAVRDSINQFLGLDFAATPQDVGTALKGAIRGVLQEEAAGEVASAREAAGLPKMPTSPARITEMGEKLKGQVPLEPSPEDLAKERQGKVTAAKQAGEFMSGTATPEEAEDQIRGILRGTVGPIEYDKATGTATGGGLARQLGDQAYEALKDKVRDVSGLWHISLDNATTLAKQLKGMNAKQKAVLLDALPGRLGEVVDNLTGAAENRGQPLPDWNTVFEAYKNFEHAEHMERDSFVKRPMEQMRQALEKDLKQALRGADRAEAGAMDSALAGSPLADEFDEITQNYARINEAARKSVIPDLLRSEQPVTQKNVVNTVLGANRVTAVLDHIWEAMTTAWDPAAGDTRSAMNAMNALKRNTWNHLIGVATDKGKGSQGVGKINWDRVLNRLTTETGYKKVFDWAPSFSEDSAGTTNRLIAYAKEQARMEAQPPRPEQMTSMFKSLKKTDREDVVNNLVHNWSLDDAQALRQHLNADPTLAPMDKELRLTALESIFRKATDALTGEPNLAKVQETLINREAALKSIIPDDGKGISVSWLRTEIDSILKAGQKTADVKAILKKYVLNNADPETILPSLFREESIYPWRRLLGKVKDNPDMVRQLVKGSWDDLVKSATADVSVGERGAETTGPGAAGTGPMSYTSGMHLYHAYRQGRPKLIAALEHLPAHEAKTILESMDSIAESTKNHWATLAMMRSAGMTKALASISSLTQAEASLATGNIGMISSLISKLAMRVKMADYFYKPAQSPFVEAGQLRTAAWNQAASIIYDQLKGLDPTTKRSVYALSAALVPREARRLIKNLQNGKDYDGQPLNPYQPSTPSQVPPMPVRPSSISGANP